MIMRKSSTGIKIESYDDFQDITLKFKMNFNIDPPSTNSILESFIKDENSINKILEDFSFYKIIEDIFLHGDNKCLEILDNELIFQFKEQSAKLQINRVFIIDKDRIESINLRLQHIENKIEYISLKQCKEFNFQTYFKLYKSFEDVRRIPAKGMII